MIEKNRRGNSRYSYDRFQEWLKNPITKIFFDEIKSTRDYFFHDYFDIDFIDDKVCFNSAKLIKISGFIGMCNQILECTNDVAFEDLRELDFYDRILDSIRIKLDKLGEVENA